MKHPHDHRGWPIRGMEARIRAIACILFLLCTSQNLLANTPKVGSAPLLEPVGFGVHEHLGSPLYSAALYLPSGASTDLVYRSETPKELRLKVETDQWRPRQWRRHWQGTLSLPASATEQDQKALQRFLGVLDQPLNRNDWIVLRRGEKALPTLIINGTVMMAFPSDRLLDAIVSSLLGDIPPSRRFKQGLLGLETPKPDWQSDFAYDALKQLQTQNVAKWRSAIAYQANEQEKAQALQEAKDAKIAREKAARSIAAKLERIRQHRLEQEAREKAMTDHKVADRQRQLQWQAQRQQQRSAEVQEYYLQWLQWQWRQKVRAEIEYPEWARKLKQEGLVVARFKVNGKGEVEAIDISQEAPSMLAAEMRRVIQSFSGRIGVPSQLRGEEWWFTASHDFKFGRRTQARLKPPVKPAFLTGPVIIDGVKNSS